jgi:outer membrane protein insertion porin family
MRWSAAMLLLVALAALALGRAQAQPAGGPGAAPNSGPSAAASGTARHEPAAGASAASAAPTELPPPLPTASIGPTPESGLDAATRRLVERPAIPAELLAQPIRGTTLESSGRRWTRTPSRDTPALDRSLLGQPLSEALAARALRTLLESGGYAEARAEAQAVPGGVWLRFQVVPRRLVAALRVNGDELDLDKTLSAAALSEGSEITERELDDAAERVRKLYQSHGFESARVRVSTGETDDRLRMLVNLEIEPGERRTITQRIFVIEPALEPVVGELREKYAIGDGDGLDEEQLEQADRDLALELQHASFLRARVQHRVLVRGPQVFLYVYLDPGPLFRVELEGERSFDESALREALDLEANPETDPQQLGERLRGFYRVRSFYDVAVDPAVLGGPKDPIRTIRLHITEGRALRITRRAFPCLEPTAESEELGTDDIDQEIVGVLEQALPAPGLFTAVDPDVIDQQLGPTDADHRPTPRRLEPATTYDPDAYDRVVKHLRDLVHSKGYLNAAIGPASLLRPRCAKNSRGNSCRPLPLPRTPLGTCQRDAAGLPVAEVALGDAFACKPDPLHGLHCSPTATVSIPIQLGPRTTLYDVAFDGNARFSSKELLELCELDLGGPLSLLAVDAARMRVLNQYRDAGYAYAQVQSSTELSPDRTRARARFTINEHEPVVVTGYEVRGAARTDPALVLRRLALCQDLEQCSEEERYYRRDLVRKSEEQIATLGTFASVSISLEDPDVPQKYKRVIITVVEQPAQYLEPRIGFSTGEGFRMAFEYGHRNIGGQAIGLTVRLELSILPDLLITDSQVRAQYDQFNLGERLERRNSIGMRFPEIGLGPQIALTLDGLDVRDNQRNFALSKEAFVPALNYDPLRTLHLQLGLSTELNDVTVFGVDTVEQAIQQNPALADVLRVPDGQTLALAQRLSVVWDRRDNAFSATRGTLVSVDVEHVHALPTNSEATITSEFMRFHGRLAAYAPLVEHHLVLAVSLAGGYNLQLTSDSQTYPDRLFYLGGVDTIRGFALDSVVPEDIAQRMLSGELPVTTYVVRGGDLYLNPRAELRVPLTDVFGVGLFLDTGNVWTKDATFSSPVDLLHFRYAVGTGVRIATPIGPIALDVGFNLIRRQWEDFAATHFAIGLF